MSWLLIPGLCIGLGLIVYLLSHFYDYEWTGFVLLPLFIIFIVSIIICPVKYYDGLNDSIKAESYYEYVIEPNIIKHENNYVVVDNNISSIWQSGGYNLVSYNSYLSNNRYWRKVPILGSTIYPAPDNLKLVKLNSITEGR